MGVGGEIGDSQQVGTERRGRGLNEMGEGPLNNKATEGGLSGDYDPGEDQADGEEERLKWSLRVQIS